MLKKYEKISNIKDGVSVVVTLFNYSKFIKECIRSFGSQDVDFPCEMIIVDDGSTDGGHVVAANEAGRCRHDIVIEKFDSNRGYSFAKNHGIRMARFGYIKILDADDMLYDGCLRNGFEALSSDCEFVHGPCLVHNWKNNKLVSSGLHRMEDEWVKHKDGASPYLGIHAQGTMYHRSLHSKFGLYDETMSSKADREMWARFYHNGVSMCRKDHIMAIYRQHPKQMSRSVKKKYNLKSINDYFNDVVLRRKNGDMRGLEMLK
jgi:glycosyltransferase involved in cell wall biosynthesis